MAIEIEQPFGDDANDLPLEEYILGLERTLLEMLPGHVGAASSERDAEERRGEREANRRRAEAEGKAEEAGSKGEGNASPSHARPPPVAVGVASPITMGRCVETTAAHHPPPAAESADMPPVAATREAPPAWSDEAAARLSSEVDPFARAASSAAAAATKLPPRRSASEELAAQATPGSLLGFHSKYLALLDGDGGDVQRLLPSSSAFFQSHQKKPTGEAFEA